MRAPGGSAWYSMPASNSWMLAPVPAAPATEVMPGTGATTCAGPVGRAGVGADAGLRARLRRWAAAWRLGRASRRPGRRPPRGD